jgi:hypothetical protein
MAQLQAVGPSVQGGEEGTGPSVFIAFGQSGDPTVLATPLANDSSGAGASSNRQAGTPVFSLVGPGPCNVACTRLHGKHERSATAGWVD